MAAFPEATEAQTRDREVERLLRHVESRLLDKKTDEIDPEQLQRILDLGRATLAAHGYERFRTQLLEESGSPGSVELRKAVVAETRAEILDPHFPSVKRWEMFGMLLVVTGGALGLLLFAPLCERLGRRGAFLVFQLGGVVGTIITFQYLSGVGVLVVALPIFGFLTLGMLGGASIYFPELYPTRLRSTGAGFCFNVGRVLAAPILFVSGWMRRDWGLSLEDTACWLSLLFLAGAFLLLFARETKGQDLPE